MKTVEEIYSMTVNDFLDWKQKLTRLEFLEYQKSILNNAILIERKIVNVEKTDGLSNKWETSESVCFNFWNYHYRLIPKPAEKYVPFTIDDWHQFWNRPIKLKTAKEYYAIIGFGINYVAIGSYHHNFQDYQKMLEDFEIMNRDGSTRPFGKEVK